MGTFALEWLFGLLMYREKAVKVKGACYHAPFLFAKKMFLYFILYTVVNSLSCTYTLFILMLEILNVFFKYISFIFRIF